MPALTRKHYVALAEIIRHENMLTQHLAERGTPNGTPNGTTIQARNDLLRSIREALVEFCYDHCRAGFSGDTFRDACDQTNDKEYSA